MFYWLILTTFSFTLVTGEELDTYEFSTDRYTLTKCIENYFLNFAEDPYYHQEIGVTKNIANLLANRFSGKIKGKNDFLKSAYNFYNNLRRRKLHIFRNHEIHKPLKWVIREALIDCANSNHVPIFEHEPQELAIILDHILVYWPMSLSNMIRFRVGRSMLRRYAEVAQTALDSGLNYLGHNCTRFRVVIREMWMRRAQNYFDGRMSSFPYLRYRYTTRGVRVFDEFYRIYLTRRDLNFSSRNPNIPPGIVNDFLLLHNSERPPYVESDMFAEYEHNHMSSAHFYIETQIDQFYRILLYFMELQSHGISTQNDDFYEGSIPDYVVSERLQRVIFNDDAYRNYLLSLRRSCRSGLSYQPEDLVSYFSSFIKLKVYVVGNNTSATFTSSTTPNYNSRSDREGSVLTKDIDSGFCKSTKTAEREEQKFQNNDFKYYGYVFTDNGDSHVEYSKDDLLTALKLAPYFHEEFYNPKICIL